MADKPEAKPGGSEPKMAKDAQRPKGRPGQMSPTKAIVAASGKEVRGVVRLAGKDLNGGLPIKRAITSVKGVGINLGNIFSQIAFRELHMNEKTLVGELSEQEVEKLEHIMKNPASYGVPVWMLNRQRDFLTGNDAHLISSDLTYTVRQDIDHEKDANTWRGYRHAYGQKVRGQHTRSTGRTGMTVGVLRKAVLAKAGEAAAAAQTGAQAAGAAAAGAKAAPGAKAPAGAPKAAAPAAGAKAPAAAKPAAKPEAKK